MAPDDEHGSRPGWLAEVSQHLGYGLSWALSTAAFLLAGWWLDGRLGTVPLFTILGAFVGAGAGFYNVYRKLIVEPREREAKKEQERRKRGH